jgi:hypothetical protein
MCCFYAKTGRESIVLPGYVLPGYVLPDMFCPDMFCPDKKKAGIGASLSRSY